VNNANTANDFQIPLQTNLTSTKTKVSIVFFKMVIRVTILPFHIAI